MLLSPLGHVRASSACVSSFSGKQKQLPLAQSGIGLAQHCQTLTGSISPGFPERVFSQLNPERLPGTEPGHD